MSIYRPTPFVANRSMATMHALVLPTAPTPQAPPTAQIANPPNAASLAQGTGSDLTVTWSAPTVDGTHDAATGFNLWSSPSGAASWTKVSGVTSPYNLSGLAAGVAVDVQLQSLNDDGTSAWSATSTLTTAVPAPNTPASISLAQGSGSDLTVIWTAPVIDNMHGAATKSNLRSSPAGAGTWTTVSDVTSPYDLSGLAVDTAIDVQLQNSNAKGMSAWSDTSTLTTAAGGLYAPNVPAITGVAPPPDGTTSKLKVSWTPPVIDTNHGAATGFNLRYSVHATNSWTVVSGVNTGSVINGLAGGTSYDVQVAATNASTASPGSWSSSTTANTYGATLTAGELSAGLSQTRGASLLPSGGLNFYAVAAPTAPAFGYVAFGTSGTILPTTGLLVAGPAGTNKFGAYCNAPATAGTYYVWDIMQNSGSVVIGALVAGPITVT